MNEEEKEAIEFFENLEFDEYEWWINDGKTNLREEDFDRFEKTWSTLLNYISKLQKENEKLKNEKEPAGEFFMSKNGVVIKVIDNREEKRG